MNRRNSEILLEYKRMREERDIRDIQENVPPVSSIFDIPGITPVAPTPQADTGSYIAINGDTVDGGPMNTPRHVEASEHPGHRHGAKLCMISAVVHMKRLAQRKAKSVQELRKNPLTTAEEAALQKNKEAGEGSDEESENDIFAHIRNCRYIRGNDEHELSIEDIFH